MIFNFCNDLSKRLTLKSGKLVFTNGCFDILHVGHLRLLQYAKGLGDILVVGLNSDDSIKRIKGASRPIITENERKEMLEGFKCVDFVVIFTEDTPLELITILKPDILVKGGDWNIDKIVGYDFVKSYGGIVKTFPYLEDHSTTKICESIAPSGSIHKNVYK